MSVLKELQGALRTLRPPCRTCPYRLGSVQFVENPCPMCRMNGYRTYDDLTRGRGHMPGIRHARPRRDGAEDGRRLRG